MRWQTAGPFLLAASILPAWAGAAEMPRAVLEDKIRGGLIGQVLGNLNGLPHEMKYIAEPGNVTDYVPSLPQGARTDDDTDIEWIYVCRMEDTGQFLLPYQRIVEIWKTHINRSIWCANLYARRLMDLGIEPPLTGSDWLNPWSEFNISGQFICEAFGLMAPGMPQTASRTALHYTHVTIEGEPAQTTQLFATMIAMAFVEDDIERILDAGVTAIDAAGTIHEVVDRVRRWHRESPRDWKQTRAKVKEAYTRHAGGIRDQNGYELNTASTIAALLYGEGDLVRTLQTAFNFGWDADNNAATAATIIGVLRGRAWVDAQRWKIGDAYANTTRDSMPNDETLTRYGDRLIAVAMEMIKRAGGREFVHDGRAMARIPLEKPARIEALADPKTGREHLVRSLRPRIETDLASADTQAKARGAYMAIGLELADELSAKDPEQWASAVAALRTYDDVVKVLFRADVGEGARRLQARALDAGLTPPAPRRKQE